MKPSTGQASGAASVALPGEKTLLRALELALAQVPGVTAPAMAGITARLHRGAGAPEIAGCLRDTTPLRARSGVMSADEIVAAASSGSPVMADAPGGWLVASQRTASTAQVVLVTTQVEKRVAPTPSGLRQILGDSSVQSIVLEPRLGLESLSARATGSHSPWSRLRALLVLERADLIALSVYAVVLGGLSLAVPLAVQVLVTTIAFGSLFQPLVVLSALLFGVLAFSGVIQVLQWYAAEVLQRRMFVRIAEDFARRLPTLRFENHDHVHAPELSNRFFEVVNLQKTLSQLLVEALGLCLQTLVAMLLLAFYHPILLAFDAALIVALLIVLGVGYGAVSTAVGESKAKYRVAAWLQQVAAHPTLFGRNRGQVAAAVTADALTRDYLGSRRRHYTRVLRQLVGGVGVQVFAMVVLLGMGGWLVMNGELTLGQLVAAELVVGVIGVGFAKSGKHLEAVYDLLAGLEKVGKVIDQPVAVDGLDQPTAPARLSLVLRDVRVAKGGGTPSRALDVDVHAGARVLLEGAGGTGKSSLLEALAGLRRPATGTIRVDAVDLPIPEQSDLREQAWLVLPGAVVEGSILENLRLGDLQLDSEGAWELLRTVKLAPRIRDLADGIHTKLLTGGGPLSTSEVVRLCLARALAAAPGLLLIDGALDDLGLADVDRDAILDAVLGPDARWTAVIVSNHEAVKNRSDSRISMDPQPHAGST